MSPYEILEELLNAPPPMPSRDEMCNVIARYEMHNMSREDFEHFYMCHRPLHLDEYEKQSTLEQAYNQIIKA